MMKFDDPDVSLTLPEISRIEHEIGLRFPTALRDHYLTTNGGSPDPYVYEDEKLDTALSECLPLMSMRGTHTAVETYRTLVVDKGLVPRQFFPFAVDGGGNYFFVDCSSQDADVHVYLHDTQFESVVSLGVTLQQFWARLKNE